MARAAADFATSADGRVGDAGLSVLCARQSAPERRARWRSLGPICFFARSSSCSSFARRAKLSCDTRCAAAREPRRCRGQRRAAQRSPDCVLEPFPTAVVGARLNCRSRTRAPPFTRAIDWLAAAHADWDTKPESVYDIIETLVPTSEFERPRLLEVRSARDALPAPACPPPHAPVASSGRRSRARVLAGTRSATRLDASRRASRPCTRPPLAPTRSLSVRLRRRRR